MTDLELRQRLTTHLEGRLEQAAEDLTNANDMIDLLTAEWALWQTVAAAAESTRVQAELAKWRTCQNTARVALANLPRALAILPTFHFPPAPSS